MLTACWAHTRRKLSKVAEAIGPPVATEALRGGAELYFNYFDSPDCPDTSP